MKRSTCLLLILGLAAAAGSRALAQTQQPPALPPAPSPNAPPSETRPDFSGTWSIDRGLSNDPAQARFEGTQSTGSQGTTQRRGGFGGGLGGFGRGGGYGGSSGNRNRSASNDGTTADEKARLAALTDELKKASATLVISHHEPSFVVTNALDHAFFCHTTGELEEQRVGEITMPSTTHWEGDRLVSELDLSSRRRLIYTYTMLTATRQLVLRVRLDVTSGGRNDVPELKLVYRLAPATASK